MIGMRETSRKEDEVFKGACKKDTITCLEAVEYLRKSNSTVWKRYAIIMLLPERLRETVRVQCTLERLI